MAFSPSEIAQELSILSSHGAVIVGGQAVNIWCEIYGDALASPWSENRPFTSRDADGFAATEKHMLDAARALEKAGYEVEVFLPEGTAERRINMGALRVTKGKHTLEINIRREIKAVPAREIDSTAVSVPVAAYAVRVLHPLFCLESKAACLLDLPQEDRTDKKHLVLSIANVRAMLSSLAKRGEPAALQIADQLIRDAHTDLAVDLFRRHGIRLLEAVPWERLADSPLPALAQFAARRVDALGKFDSYLQAAEELSAMRKSIRGAGEPPPEKA